MVVRKRKKNVRFRGSKTHGYGSMKKHRGAGHRGGRGNAGSGKRADGKKPSFWQKESRQGGKNPMQKGFFSITREEQVTINIGHLASIADSLVRSGHAISQKDAIVLNLSEMGYTKLLGAGTVKRKLNVRVALCTPSAKEKIEAAGGSIDADVSDKEGTLGMRAAKKAAKTTPKGAKKEEPKKAAADDE